MKMEVLKIPGSDRFCAEGKRPELDAISPKLKIFPYDESHEIDPITMEVVAHKLWQINDEQGQALKKISGSPVATDANDFNVVLCDELGDIVNIGPYYLPHAANIDFMLGRRAPSPGRRGFLAHLCRRSALRLDRLDDPSGRPRWSEYRLVVCRRR
jgi:N-methylhydantoinase B